MGLDEHDHRENAPDLDALLLSRYQDGEVSNQERHDIEERLARDPTFKKLYQELNDVTDWVKEQDRPERAALEAPGAAAGRQKRFAETLDALEESPTATAASQPAPKRAVSMSYWRQLRGVLVTAAAAIMLLVGWWVVQDGEQTGLNAYAERIRDVASEEILRQYKVRFEPNLLKTPDDWPADKLFPKLEPFEGALYTMGGDRFLLRHRLPARHDRPEDEVVLGGQAKKRWLTLANTGQWVEVDSADELPRRFSKTDLYYMELDSIIGQLGGEYAISEAVAVEADLQAFMEDLAGVDVKGALRVVRFTAKDPEASLDTVEIVADEAAEIHGMMLHVYRPGRFEMSVRLTRTTADADPAAIFEPQTHLPANAEKVDVDTFFKDRFGGRHRKSESEGKASEPAAAKP